MPVLDTEQTFDSGKQVPYSKLATSYTPPLNPTITASLSLIAFDSIITIINHRSVRSINISLVHAVLENLPIKKGIFLVPLGSGKEGRPTE